MSAGDLQLCCVFVTSTSSAGTFSFEPRRDLQKPNEHKFYRGVKCSSILPDDSLSHYRTWCADEVHIRMPVKHCDLPCSDACRLPVGTTECFFCYGSCTIHVQSDGKIHVMQCEATGVKIMCPCCGAQCVCMLCT